jgi:DNA polymerase III subunit delta
MSFSVEKALQHRVILLAGDEEFLRREALRALLDASGASDEDFDLQHFDAGESSPAEWAAAVGTAPFLSARRTGIVRHLLRVETDRLGGIDLKALPPTALLILVADDEGGDETKQQRLRTVRQHWEKMVAGAEGFVAPLKADVKALTDTLRREASERGKPLASGGAQLLAEMCGSSLSRSIGELEKVILFAGDEPSIREDHIRQVVVPSREWNVFRLVDATLSGEVAEALNQLRILVGSPGKAEDAAFRNILPNVSRTLRLLWQARLCLDASAAPGDPPPQVRAMFPERPNLASEKSFVQSKVMKMARGVSLAQLAGCLAVLADTDARLKGGLPAFNANETLERMVLEMAKIVRAA